MVVVVVVVETQPPLIASTPEGLRPAQGPARAAISSGLAAGPVVGAADRERLVPARVRTVESGRTA